MCNPLVAPDVIFKMLKKNMGILVHSSNMKMYAGHNNLNLRKVCSFKIYAFVFILFL
jgi:hypothetical protein